MLKQSANLFIKEHWQLVLFLSTGLQMLHTTDFHAIKRVLFIEYFILWTKESGKIRS